MRNKVVVSIARGDDQAATTLEAGGDRLREVIKPGDRVILKINQVAGLPPEMGSTTSPRTIEVVAQLALEAKAGEVAVAEDAGRFFDTTEVFRKLGTEALAKRMGLTLLDLRKEPHRRVKVPDPLVAEASEVEFSVPLLECDVLIGLTKLKTHHQAGITGAMKNMYGAITDHYKALFHRRDLEWAIVDLNTIRKADFTIVDGFPAMEGVGPHNGDPVPINIVIAGMDPVAVDTVCAAVMGFKLDQVRQLEAAKEKALGVTDLSQIQICGVPIAEVARPFKTCLDQIESQLKGYVEIKGTPCTGCAGVVATTAKLLRR